MNERRRLMMLSKLSLAAGLYDSSGALLVSWADSGINNICSNASSIIKDNYPTCTKLVLAETVTRIANLSRCAGLTEIIIPISITSIDGWSMYGNTGLTSITYNGTKAQWDAIAKGGNWNNTTGDYILHCTDGDYPKE